MLDKEINCNQIDKVETIVDYSDEDDDDNDPNNDDNNPNDADDANQDQGECRYSTLRAGRCTLLEWR